VDEYTTKMLWEMLNTLIRCLFKNKNTLFYISLKKTFVHYNINANNKYKTFFFHTWKTQVRFSLQFLKRYLWKSVFFSYWNLLAKWMWLLFIVYLIYYSMCNIRQN